MREKFFPGAGEPLPRHDCLTSLQSVGVGVGDAVFFLWDSLAASGILVISFRKP